MLFGEEDDEETSPVNLGKTADIILEEDKERSGAAGANDQQEGVSERLTNAAGLLGRQDVVDLDYLDDFSDIDGTLVDGADDDGVDSLADTPHVLATQTEKPQKEQIEKSPHVSLEVPLDTYFKQEFPAILSDCFYLCPKFEIFEEKL